MTNRSIESGNSSVSRLPVSPHYSPLEWLNDEWNMDYEDAIAATGDDWTYQIWPVHSDSGSVMGYRVHGGDPESGCDLGSALIDGERGEVNLEDAKATAQTDYASRYCEAEDFLNRVLGVASDDDGPLAHYNEQGRIVCRVDVPGMDEVEVVATLKDEFDDFDPDNRTVTVCLRTLMRNGGDCSLLLEVIDFEIHRKSHS
ncbi:MAG: hypothetical protein K2Y33_01830 [Mycolicibacterium frederiksbergense]|nr:hypothetical protein [Mycolicibacterium frederiksbergense]